MCLCALGKEPAEWNGSSSSGRGGDAGSPKAMSITGLELHMDIAISIGLLPLVDQHGGDFLLLPPLFCFGPK